MEHITAAGCVDHGRDRKGGLVERRTFLVAEPTSLHAVGDANELCSPSGESLQLILAITRPDGLIGKVGGDDEQIDERKELGIF